MKNNENIILFQNETWKFLEKSIVRFSLFYLSPLDSRVLCKGLINVCNEDAFDAPSFPCLKKEGEKKEKKLSSSLASRASSWKSTYCHAG